MNTPTLSTGTPTLKVFDNRGATVRTLQYNRTQLEGPLNRLVSHVSRDEISRISRWRDPRRFNAWLGDASAVANLAQTASLTGQVLLRQSTDSGWQAALFDVQGRLVWTRNGRGTVHRVDYDVLGRPVAHHTQPGDGRPAYVSARFVYGDADRALLQPQAHNLRGVCVRQYDQAGKRAVDSVALSGAVLRSSQTFLRSAQAPADWRKDENHWAGALEAISYATLIQANALGATLGQTDAGGHHQRWAYDVSGQPCRQQLTLAGQSRAQTLYDQVAYTAAGRVLQETTTDAFTTTYTYQTQTQRLKAMSVVRHHDKALLQSLAYSYDPVGNLTALADATVATRYFRNQAANGDRTFAYDALSRLLTATGREQAQSPVQDNRLPALLTPIPRDDSQYANYTRTYTYDDSGNLATLVHAGASHYTQTMVTDQDSNRSLRAHANGLTPQDVGGATWFDANGNLHNLQTQPAALQSLIWSPDDQLQTVVLLNRDKNLEQSDREIYQYREGVRVRKQTRRLINTRSNLWAVEEVRYLQGLEWRTTYQETPSANGWLKSPDSQSLQTIVGQAGRSSVRILHWQLGKPSGLSNDLVRYGLDDPISSSRLEVDARGQTISREEYYPFGGTAVWAARSQLEADYKVVRYSGKERDATGLYYYGYRYYAPWLCRWISADPAGEVDGLNLYRMVRNNPMTLRDPDGLDPTESLDWLDLASTSRSGRLESAIYATRLPVQQSYRAFTGSTRAILEQTQANEQVLKKARTPAQRNKQSQAMQFTNARLKGYAAHAGVLNTGNQHYKDGFLNFAGNLSSKGTFPGVEIVPESRSSRLSAYHPDTLASSKAWRPAMDLGYYRVTDENVFVSAIQQQYSAAGTPLHAVVEARIRQHIARNDNVLPKMAGIAGLHAEVQALNYALSQPRTDDTSTSATLNDLFIYTQRLVGATGEDFPACHNCAGIISGLENVMTGKVRNHARLTRRHSI